MVKITSEFVRKTFQEPLLSGFFGGVVIAAGYAWRPFLSTTVLHGAVFALSVTLVANVASYCFSKMGIEGKKNTLLSYSIGAIVALAGSVGFAYVGLLTSTISLAGAILLTITAVAATKIFKHFAPQEQLALNNKPKEQMNLNDSKTASEQLSMNGT